MRISPKPLSGWLVVMSLCGCADSPTTDQAATRVLKPEDVQITLGGDKPAETRTAASAEPTEE